MSQTLSSPPRAGEIPAGPAQTPRTFEAPWAEAHALARECREPIFVPVATHTDDRGWSLMNLMVGVLSQAGQINFSWQHPGAIKAWHLHERQTDFWCCVSGHLKAGVYRPDDGASWMHVFGQQRAGVLIIPPGLWHGATAVGADPAGLLYYVTNAYDPSDPDEQRRPHDSVPGFEWGVRHG